MHYNSGPRQSAPVRHPMSEPYNAASDLLDRNIAAGRADKVAFIDRERRMTYDELRRQSARLANLLQRRGVRREDRVALVLLDTLLTAEQYAYILADTRARVAFVSKPLLAAIEPARAKLKDLE